MINAFEINLIIISSVCLFFWLGFLYLTHNIKPAMGGGKYDNDLMIEAAAKSSEWRWFSDMHTKTYTGTATSQKDLTIILLAIFQRIFRDKNGEFPIVALWGFAHATSAFLIYLIGSNYWNPNVALLISIFYLSTFWMWQMSLFVGHLNVGTMFFLLAVYFLTQGVGASTLLINIWLLAAGFSFCCMLFASSSSLRYVLLFFVAVFFAKHQTTTQDSLYQTIIGNNSLIPSLILTSIFIISLILIKIFYQKIITAIYNKEAGFLNSLISAKKYALEHYIGRAKEQLPNILRWLIKLYIFLFVIINLIGFNYLIPLLLGFVIVLVILTMPNIKRSLTFYFNYLYISYMKPGINSGLVRYVRLGYFAQNNLKVPSNLRGGGYGWVPKIFFKMAPLHTSIYFVSLIFILLNTGKNNILNFETSALLILTSLLPILWAELTKAYQVSRSYSSGLIGFLVPIGFAAYFLSINQYFWPFAGSLVALTFLWNFWKFFKVIYPARMSFNKIIKTLTNLGVNEIYTYNTFYNDTFLDNIKRVPSFENFKINFIDSLKEVRDGWIFIPATTHKAGYIRQEESIQQGDFTQDPALNNLLETKRIEKIASAKFQTICGSDDIWLQEADIITYFDLMLHYIGEKDHFRGYAWLLHSSKLR